jgi:aminoglycoside phosphotransferase (APT) family kinase protein
MSNLSENILFKKEWRNDGSIREVRRQGTYISKRSIHAKKEYAILSKINKNSKVLVPEAISVDGDVLIMTFLKGHAVKFSNGNQEILENQMFNAGLALGQLHQIDVRELSEYLKVTYTSLSDLIMSRYEDHMAMKTQSEHIYYLQRFSLKNYCKENRWLLKQCKDLPAIVSRKFVHGDFCHRNIIVSDEEVGIIDFESAYLGYVEDDLARFISKIYLVGALNWRNKLIFERLEQAFLEGYKVQGRYDDNTYKLLKYVFFHRYRIKKIIKNGILNHRKEVFKSTLQNVILQRFLHNEYIKLKQYLE